MKAIMKRAEQHFLEKFPEINRIFLPNTNKIGLIGKIEDDFYFSHERYGKLFFKTCIKVPNNDAENSIPITVPEELIVSDFGKDKMVKVIGMFRSRNEWEDGKSYLKLSVMAKYLSFCDVAKPENFVYLEGYLCKKPIHIKRSSGRKKTDLLIAVNEAYEKVSYIPCVAWGGYAIYASQLEIGNKIEFWGRIQSRQYQKHEEIKTAYEVLIVRWF